MHWPPTTPLLTVLILCALATAALELPVLRILQRRNVHSLPNHRTSHDTPTPRGGGVAMVAVLAVAGAVVALTASESLVANGGILSRPRVWIAVVAMIIFGTLGLMDDVSALSANVRLATQVVVSTVSAFTITSGIESPLPAWALGIGLSLWTIFFVNAFNFMDGINGISIAQMSVAGLAVVASQSQTTLLAVLGAALLGAALGFSPYNFRNRGHAKVFLGDSGSYGLGYLIAVLLFLACLQPYRSIAPWPLAAAGLATADVLYTLARRALRRAPLFEAHREHLYQKLTAPPSGWSHITMSCVHLLAGVALVVVAATLFG